MIIHRVLNNNAVMCFDEKNEEVIIKGKGVAYRKRAGDELDKAKIEKVFVCDSKETTTRYQEILACISIDCIEFSEEAIDIIKNKIDKKIVLPRGLFVYRKKDKLVFTTKEIVIEETEFTYKIPVNGFVKINEANMIIETEKMPINRYKALKKDKSLKWFDYNKIKGEVIVRNRKAGDKIKLSMGSKKLKQLFIDLKVPKDQRSKIPIIQDDNGILCVGDFRNSEEYKIDETTKEVLKICFKKI